MKVATNRNFRYAVDQHMLSAGPQSSFTPTIQQFSGSRLAPTLFHGVPFIIRQTQRDEFGRLLHNIKLT
jgi:hypothetical protein